MNTEDAHIQQKQVVFITFQSTTEIEKAFQLLKAENVSKLELSILGKFNQGNFNKIVHTEIETIKKNCKKLTGHSIGFDSFNNPEIGTVFIAGPLVTIFLREVSGKPLAAMSSGPYGIFRGLGASEAQATQFVKTLSHGHYLLIIRGFTSDLKRIQKILEI